MATVREFEVKSLADRPLRIVGLSIPDNLSYDVSDPSLKITYEEKKVRGKKAILTKTGVDLIEFNITFTSYDQSSYTSMLLIMRYFIQAASNAVVQNVKHWSLEPYSVYQFVVASTRGPTLDKDGLSSFTVNLKEWNPDSNKSILVKKPEIDLKKYQIEASGVAGLPPDVVAPPTAKFMADRGKNNLAK